MRKRKLAIYALVPLAVLNALNALNVVELGWLLWPLAIAILIAAAIVITTPRDEGISNG